MIRVFITDDHEMYLEGLSLLLGKQEGYTRSSRYCLYGKAFTVGTIARITSGYFTARRAPSRYRGRSITTTGAISAKRSEDHLSDLAARDALYSQTYQTQYTGIRVEECATPGGCWLPYATVHGGGNYFSKDINIGDKDEDFRNTIVIDDKQIDEILSRREH